MKKLLTLIIIFCIVILGAFYFYQANSSSEQITTKQVETEIHSTNDSSSSEDVTISTTTSALVEQSTNTTSQEKSTVVMSTKEVSNNQVRPELPMTEIKSLEGEQIKLRDFNNGKPTLIKFWASWCPPCKAEMPYFQTAYDQYKDKVNFVMINATGSQATETEAAANDFIADYGYTFPVYYDINYQNQIAFSTRSLPATLFFDKEGYLITAFGGQIPEATLFQMLEEIH